MEKYESMMNLVRRYGVIGVIMFVTPFLMPYLDEYLKTQKNDAIQIIIHEEMDRQQVELAKKFNHIEERISYNLTAAVEAHALSKVTDNQALYIMKAAVGYQSIYKKEWLKNFISYKQLTEKRQATYENIIASELRRQTSIYTHHLNTFVHPKLGKLGEYVSNNLASEECINNILKIIFNSKEDKRDRVEDAFYYMISLQNTLWVETEKKLEN